MNVEGDRLSSLPDDLIHKILSFIGIKHAVESSVLSSRWRDHYYYYGPDYLLRLSTDLLHLDKVDMRINYPPYGNKAYTHKIVCLFEQLHSVKFLTLNLELVKLLSSSVELISHQPSPFVNLKCLKIYPPNYVTEPKVTMSTEIKNYLLDGSPGATLTMVSHEEIRAVMNVASARNRMGELQVLLDQWKENSETNKSHMKQNEAPMESHTTTVHEQGEVETHRARDKKMKCHFQERMAHVKSYWEVLNEQLEKGYNKTRRSISLLREIEGLLKKVPRSDRAKLQTRFSGLRAEAETIMDNVMDCVKIQCDKRPSR
ncbi:hypothetical protein L1987_72247 [Smallanthus sonchifolius]|uniref:Uncharacterized protein n=1 Tax=Smallanthus sonchifolius TaxID=185202 RepID=A0ACB9AVI9_9ASTR|nr:hypothetical protein L1987_72247 [Smallanthus sonchifolius]